MMGGHDTTLASSCLYNVLTLTDGHQTSLSIASSCLYYTVLVHIPSEGPSEADFASSTDPRGLSEGGEKEKKRVFFVYFTLSLMFAWAMQGHTNQRGGA